jgi:hypothetical protein
MIKLKNVVRPAIEVVYRRFYSGKHCRSGQLPVGAPVAFRLDGSTGVGSGNCTEHCLYSNGRVIRNGKEYVACTNVKAKITGEVVYDQA